MPFLLLFYLLGEMRRKIWVEGEFGRATYQWDRDSNFAIFCTHLFLFSDFATYIG